MAPLHFLATQTKSGLYAPFGLDMFDGRAVVIAFAVAALLQVLFVARPMGIGWGRAIGVALLLNSTWFFLLFCNGPFQFSGSPTPNPTLYAVQQITHLSILSACVLAPLWRIATKDRQPFRRVLLRSGLAFAIWIPISFLILELPYAPYEKLERVQATRRWQRLLSATRDWEGPLPVFAFPAEFASAFDLPADVIRLPSYSRFATRDEGPVVLQVNTALSGLRPGGKKRYEWLIRYPSHLPNGRWEMRERFIDLSTGRTVSALELEESKQGTSQARRDVIPLPAP